MEFNEKLQELRKLKGLTQEELAESLYVSRTAISKWESGRGYPNIDSLKLIAKFFSVSIDELLSNDELLTIAEEDNRQKTNCIRDLVFGLLDLSIAMFFFLPFFGQNNNGLIVNVSLMDLSEITIYSKAAYLVIVGLIVIMGIMTLVLQNYCGKIWQSFKNKISLFLNVIGVILFIITTQPYAATFLFILLIIKVWLLLKK